MSISLPPPPILIPFLQSRQGKGGCALCTEGKLRLREKLSSGVSQQGLSGTSLHILRQGPCDLCFVIELWCPLAGAAEAGPEGGQAGPEAELQLAL